MDTHRDYLEDFNRKVEETLRSQAQAPQSDPLRAMRGALTDFDAWWTGEHPEDKEEQAIAHAPAQTQSPQIDELRRELQQARDEILDMKRALLDRSAAAPAPAPRRDEPLPPSFQEERDALLAQIERLRQENENQRQYAGSIQEKMNDAQSKMARAQDGYEATILRLEEQNRLLNERAPGFLKDKQFLETHVSRLSERVHELEGDLEVSRANCAAMDRENLELKGRAAELQRSVSKLEAGNAALEGALAELRTQAIAIQERLLHSRDSVELELSRGRRELEKISAEAAQALQETAQRQRSQAQKTGEQIRADLSEQQLDVESRLRERRHEIEELLKQQHLGVEKHLDEQRTEVEKKLRSTAQFLETKIREIEQDATSHYDEVRGLLDTLGSMLQRDPDQP